jgi:hypothetical protein
LARPRRPGRNTKAGSFRQLRRFQRVINSDKVFGTHSLSDEIETLARQDSHCERLMTVPGIGPIISSAMVAAIGTGEVFSKGRDFGAGPRAGPEANLDGRPNHPWPPIKARQSLSVGEEPESLRGPQAEMVIADEIARMRYQQSVFDTMMLGLRLGDRPRVLIATTPRTTPFMKRLVAMDDIRITTGSTYDNAEHLSAGFLKKVRELYEGTRLGR